jgi:uncharacterized OsmC-like protein
MFRAGMAACAATVVAMKAAEEGIALTALEVKVTSRSNGCGLLGMSNATGAKVSAAPWDMTLHVRIDANGVSPQRLRDLVEEATRCSPMCAAVDSPTPIALRVEAQARAA